MESAASVITRLGTAATRQQLLAAGLSGFDLTVAVRRGEIIRCRQARYVLPTTSPVIRAAVRVGGRLAGPSAASTYGLWAGFDLRLHIQVGHNSARLRTNYAPSILPSFQTLTPDRSEYPIVVHWVKNGAVPERASEIWRVPVEDCLRQMVEWSDRETAVACLDTAITVLGLSAGHLRRLFAGSSARSRLIAASARPGSDAGTESLVRQRLEAIGLKVDQQVAIEGVGRVDMRIRGTRVLIEVDGFAFHGEREAFERDHTRTAELVARKFVVVRLSYSQVTTDWPWCLRMVRMALADT